MIPLRPPLPSLPPPLFSACKHPHALIVLHISTWDADSLSYFSSSPSQQESKHLNPVKVFQKEGILKVPCFHFYLYKTWSGHDWFPANCRQESRKTIETCFFFCRNVASWVKKLVCLICFKGGICICTPRALGVSKPDQSLAEFGLVGMFWTDLEWNDLKCLNWIGSWW